ncbi:MAG: hypothetical protein Q7T82_09795 [Armatimonadota bacterium]|nr:hypothetical protein [Armatimonadota bacterium]
MLKRLFIGTCCAALIIGLVPGFVSADPDEAGLQKQITELRGKLEELEKKLNDSKKAQETAPAVTPAAKGSKIKIDGRIFAGVFDTGAEGAYANSSVDISDAKIRFTFNPTKNITVVNRFSTTGAKTDGFDYFYADFAGVLSPTSIIRVGQRKIDTGQETWVDNPIENMLVTNSVSHVSGYGTGIALLGRFQDVKTSPLYEIGFVNGPKGLMVRPTNALPINIKLGAPLPGNIFASASYFRSGDIGAADKSAISVAEIADYPAATEWNRSLWEVDLRYNYGASGIRSLVPTGDLPPVMLGATYGGFNDDAVGAADRDGQFWFVEGLFRLNSRTYAAARYSSVDLDDGVLAKLGKSPVSVNSYRRTSIGLGYALTDLTHVKAEYAFNRTSGGASDPDLNQLAIGVASKF